MSVNRVTLIGNVGRDPETKVFENDNQVTNFTLATTERGYTAANGTQIPDKTEWHNIVCWRGLSKIANQFIRKGSKVYIDGKIRSRSYDDQNGIKRYVYEIYVDNLELLDRKSDDGTSSTVPNQSTQKSSSVPKTEVPPIAPPDFSSGDDTDDLPF